MGSRPDAAVPRAQRRRRHRLMATPAARRPRAGSAPAATGMGLPASPASWPLSRSAGRDRRQPLVADAYIEEMVGRLTSERITTGLRAGTYKANGARCPSSGGRSRATNPFLASLAVLGADGVSGRATTSGLTTLAPLGLAPEAARSPAARARCSGTSSANGSGLPREPSSDRDLPFNEVLRNIGQFR